MPAYATQQQIIDRYGEDALAVAADRDGDGNIDTPAVDQALLDATDEINVYLAARYDLPLPQVPALLGRLCVDIALYQLSPDGAYTEEKRQRYEDAVSLLRRISEGKASLGLETPAPTQTGSAELVSAPRLFNRKGMRRLT